MVKYTADQVAKAQSSNLPAEGKYLAEIQAEGCVETMSKKRDPMFEVSFKDVETGEFLCYDRIMMGGKGLGIGHKKLLMLGVVDDLDRDFEVNAVDLIGRRAVLTLVHEIYTGNDGIEKKSAKPDIKAEGFGYAPVGTWQHPDVAIDPSSPDTPF